MVRAVRLTLPLVLALVGVAPAPPPARGAVPWPAPRDPLVRMARAGFHPQLQESFVHHVHSHLDVFVNGKRVRVPAGIGIDVTEPNVRRVDLGGSIAYGLIGSCQRPCISPLHTHDDSGVIHTEFRTRVLNTLGQFFAEWGVRLDRKCVGGYCRPASITFYVNGKRFAGDPATIGLSDHKEIAIVIGTPPARIPTSYNF